MPQPSYAVLAKLRNCFGQAISDANDSLSEVAADNAWDTAVSKLRSWLPSDTMEGANELFANLSSDVCTLGSAGKKCSGAFGRQIVKSSPGAGYRVMSFGATPSEVRQEMLVPMLALTRRLKKNKQLLETLSDEQMKNEVTELIARDMARLTILGLETSAKMTKALNPATMGGTAASAARGMAYGLIKDKFLSVLFRKGLSLKEKLKLLTNQEEMLGPNFVDDVASKFKEQWSKENIEREIAEYTRKL